MSQLNQPLSLFGRLGAYAQLMRLDRPIGIFLLLWPTLWALWIAADGLPDLRILSLFIAGVFLMRSAGCAINDYADRNIDPYVARTCNRPLAAKRIHPYEAVLLFILLVLLAFLLVLGLNKLTQIMAVGGVLLAASYPFMKRFHYLPQVHLGIAFAWAIPMAFTAVTGQLPTSSGWMLFLAAILWTTAYDTMYAMADREDDLKVGVKSTAILFGDADRVIIGILQVMVLLILVQVGIEESFHWPYYFGLGVATIFGWYQQFLIRQRYSQECFRAFLNNNYIGMAVFAGIVAEQVFA